MNVVFVLHEINTINYEILILREIKLNKFAFSNPNSFLKSPLKSSNNKSQFTDLFRAKFIAISRDNWICLNVPNSCMSAIAFSKFFNDLLSGRLEASSINCQALIKY